MIRGLLARTAVSAGFAILFAACGSAAGNPPDPTAAPTASPSRQPVASPSPQPDPYTTDRHVSMIADREDGVAVLRICEAEALVNARGGKAVELVAASAGFQLTTPGEQIVHATGEPLADDGTLVQLPVMRDAQGRLVLGWRHCDETPLPMEEPSSDEHALP